MYAINSILVRNTLPDTVGTGTNKPHYVMKSKTYSSQGMGYTLQERQILGVHGLIPPSVRTQSEQVLAVMQNFHRWTNDLDRYIYLMGLQDRNEKLFYRVVTDNVELMMPVIYTPTVGLACQKYGLTFRKPRSVNISMYL